MIQANELRIGNYIYDDFNEVHIVEKIESEKYNEWNGSDPSLVVFSKIDDKYNGMYTCDIVSGIPLTEEWLFKFGFYKEKDMFYFKYGVITYALCADNHGFVFGICNNPNIDWFSWEIKYVNQLQNLYFAITGSELVLSNAPEATKPAL